MAEPCNGFGYTASKNLSDKQVQKRRPYVKQAGCKRALGTHMRTSGTSEMKAARPKGPQQLCLNDRQVFLL